MADGWLVRPSTLNSYHPALKCSRALQAVQEKAKSRQLSSWQGGTDSLTQCKSKRTSNSPKWRPQQNTNTSCINTFIWKVGMYQYLFDRTSRVQVLAFSTHRDGVLNKAIRRYLFTGVVLFEQHSSAGFSRTNVTAVQTRLTKLSYA